MWVKYPRLQQKTTEVWFTSPGKWCVKIALLTTTNGSTALNPSKVSHLHHYLFTASKHISFFYRYLTAAHHILTWIADSVSTVYSVWLVWFDLTLTESTENKFRSPYSVGLVFENSTKHNQNLYFDFLNFSLILLKIKEVWLFQFRFLIRLVIFVPFL